MSYSYQNERKELFTEYGAATLKQVRTEALRLLAEAGAFTAEKAVRRASGSSWTMLAALDYMVERGELIEVVPNPGPWAQHRVFTIARR